MKFEILSRFDLKVIFSIEADTIKLAVEAAIKKGVSLYGANLYGANLYGANLDGANLYGANLYGANLDGANLDGANLDGANLDGANLRCANLRCANLRCANLYGANLDGANLDGANLDGANLRCANLDGAKLKDGSVIAKSERPLITISPLGSDQHQLRAFSTDKGLRLQTGCFFGTIDEFKAALKKKHDGNEHAKEYNAALDLIELHLKLWKKSK